ncbi:MAG: cytochrome C oxidase subunit IV family protein [Chitinophagaceae bacterium]|nr:cytochrome C oxidase subunit IV family protein [Oligoflexus sp.]
MAGHVDSHDHDAHTDSDGHGPAFYIKIWAILLVLFLISVAGPEISHHKAVILVTAFGIAIVKAYMVAVNFMHIKHEKKYIAYIMFAMLGAVFLFYIAVSTDVQMTSGSNWENASAKAVIEQHKDFQEHIEHE